MDLLENACQRLPGAVIRKDSKGVRQLYMGLHVAVGGITLLDLRQPVLDLRDGKLRSLVGDRQAEDVMQGLNSPPPAAPVHLRFKVRPGIPDEIFNRASGEKETPHRLAA